MRFALTAEQQQFRNAVDQVLRDADGVKAARSWGAGDTAPGLAIWRRLAGIGLQGLAVPESAGGSGLHLVEVCCGLERVGYHAAPGPYAESIAASVYLTANGDDDGWLPRLADGAVASFAVPGESAGLPNAGIADLCIPAADPGPPVRSVDPARPMSAAAAGLPGDGRRARDVAVLLTAAQLTGLGRAALDRTVAYAKQRVQFGRVIGEYQAVKHRAADALVGLEFARLLPFAAALAPEDESSVAASAALAACAEAAYQASRAALQLHGAIGYTDEYDLSVFIKKIRALYSAWGNPSFHRARVLG
jgi:alkylation response protein AidB-like acyl-CoA dehydrogenase